MGRGPFFGSSRKMRGFPMNISPSMDDNPPFPYFADAKFSDFPYGPGGGTPQGFHDFFPGQQSQFPPGTGKKISSQNLNLNPLRFHFIEWLARVKKHIVIYSN